MKNSNESKEKIYAGKNSSAVVIVIMTAVFLVILLNLFLLYRIQQKQAISLGTRNIENLNNNLTTILEDASYMTESLAVEAQNLIDRGADADTIRNWVYTQSEKQEKLTDGDCFNVCFTSPDLIIVPGYGVDEDFDITTRTWYSGAMENDGGEVYISEPYVDLATGRVCYTSAYVLSDGKSTISLDFSMDDTQEIIMGMDSDDSCGLIVNSEGLLVGCADETFLGTKLSETYPEYTDIFDTVKFSDNSDINYINKGKNTVFYCTTDDVWYLIYSINRTELFKDIYVSMLRNIIISALLMLAILFLMVRNIKGNRQVKKALEEREKFYGNISDNIKEPVDRILLESNPVSMENSVNIKENMKVIRDNAMKLSGIVDNILVYSDIRNDRGREKKKNKNIKKKYANPKIGVLIIVILALCLTVAVIFAMQSLTGRAESEMEKNTAVATGKLTEWMTSRKNSTDMLAEALESYPGVLRNYDSMVEYLGLIAEKETDASLIYVGNADWDYEVVMSDGWTAETGYVVSAYSWYSQAIESDEGYVISQPYFDTTIRKYCITISEPLYDSRGRFLGVLGMDYSLEGITSEFENDYSKDGYEFLVTDSGLIINHPYSEYAISTSNRVDIRSLNYNKAVNNDGTVLLKDYDGTFRLCMADTEEISGFKVLVLRKAVSVYGTMAIISLAFIAFLIACIVLISVFWNRMRSWYETTNIGLKEAADKAMAADKAKMQFLAQISHELRTPINAVLGMDELIMRECDEENVIGYASDIQNAGNILLELVNGLLDFSKIENGKMVLQEAEYNTAAMIRETLNTVSDRARRAGLELITDVDGALPSLLYGDDIKIRQVIVNLLTNAIKYTPAGRVTLTVKRISMTQNEVEMYVSVRDTGIGIKPEDQKKLFNSFTRVDQDKTRTIEGTGLGLYIVNKILGMMNTKLELDSTYGEGSDFHFTIRQKVINSLRMGSFATDRNSTDTESNEKNTSFLYAPDARILVVDDNFVNLKVAKGLLKRNELKCDTVDSGSGCIELLESDNAFDIIFLDHMMPGTDGVEALKIIRDKKLVPDNVPIIVMTANAISGAKDEYLSLGFDDYISKPLDVTTLENILAKWLPKEKYIYKTKAKTSKAAQSRFNNLTDALSKQQELQNALEGMDKISAEGKADYINRNNDIQNFSEKIIQDVNSEKNKTGGEKTEGEKTGGDKTGGNKTIADEDIKSEDENVTEDDAITAEDEQYFTNEIPEINLKIGMSYAADSRSFYKEIIKEMVKNEAEKELQKYYDKKDYPNYRIKVHAMKNNLRTLGATTLGDDAFALETAVKENRIEYVLEKHDEFNKRYGTLMIKLDQWI